MKKKNLLKMAEYCAAGINFKSAANCKDIATELLSIVSSDKIDTSNDLYYHLGNCLSQCKKITNDLSCTDNYHDIVTYLLNHWDVLGNSTWTYRILMDVIKMDTNARI